jgi:hypothetical protein
MQCYHMQTSEMYCLWNVVYVTLRRILHNILGTKAGNVILLAVLIAGRRERGWLCSTQNGEPSHDLGLPRKCSFVIAAAKALLWKIP